MSNNQGKTFPIFLILMMVLLVSSAAIGFFLYQKEIQMRKNLESQLEESHQQQDKLSADLKDARKQLVLLQDKNKEADNKINNLMDEIELNEGLRNELKKENVSLKEAMESSKKEKDAIRADLDDMAKKFQENQELLKVEQNKSRDLQAKIQALEEAGRRFELTTISDNKMELDKIIVNGPETTTKGRILSVDKESEFVICSLGSRQGIKLADTLSVYRGDEYLGDIKVSRLQDEMCAADFVPPFSSQKARKNDIVVLKMS